MSHSKPFTEKIVFFDGVCGLCNGFVDFLLPRVRKRKIKDFYFSPLQGDFSKALLSEEKREKLDSIIFYDYGSYFEKSEAVLRVFQSLGGAYRILAFLISLVPRLMRDRIYDWIAKNRYLWFGQRDSCRLPSLEEKDFFKT